MKGELFMKIDWNKKYTTIAIYATIVIAFSIIFQNLIHKIETVNTKLDFLVSTLQPFIIGFIIAYLLNFIMVFIEKKVLSFKKLNNLSNKNKRCISIISTYLITLFSLYLFGMFVLPQVVESIKGLVNDIPTYISNFSNILQDINKHMNFTIDESSFNFIIEKWNEFVNYTINLLSSMLPVIGDTVKNIFSSLWNIILGIIISIYMLIDKEKLCGLIKKITYAVFSKEWTSRLITLTRRTNDTFGKFIIGKIIDSTIIGILTFIILSIFDIPYTILISVIIGITNIIPFFGPFFGAIPSFVIIMFVSFPKAIWFLVIILIIQQLDGNIIGPKILGDSIGISAFWILFSLLIAGKVLGLTGMIIGVPLFAVIYSVIKEIVESNLKKKGLPTDTNEYISK